MTIANNKPIAAEVTDSVIAEWKKQHAGVFKFSSADGKVGYFKSPDIVALEASLSLNQTGHPIESNRLLAKSCFLGGDTGIYENQENLLGLGDKLKGLIKKVEGELTEL